MALAAAHSCAPSGQECGIRVQVICKGIRDYLNRHENRCLLIVIGNSPLVEAECRALFSRYGAVRKLKLTSNNAAAFVDFECEHAPLLVAKCFALRQRNPMMFFPKGAETLLPACSVDNFLYLEGVPRELSTSALMSHFMKFNNGLEVVIHRPGSGIHLSSRVVVQLNGIEASDYTKHQKRLTSMMENGKVLQFYAIPQLEQLTNDKSIFEKNGCGLCKVSALKQSMVGLDSGDQTFEEDRAVSRIEEKAGCVVSKALPYNFPSVKAEIEKNLVSSAHPSQSACHDEFEKKWAFPKPAKVFPPPRTNTAPSRRSIPPIMSVQTRRPFDTGERWDDVPEGSGPIPWETEEKKDCRSPAPPPDPKQPVKDRRSEGLDWRNFGKEGGDRMGPETEVHRCDGIGWGVAWNQVRPPPASQPKSKPKARSIPSLISIALNPPRMDGGEKKDQPVVGVQPVRPDLRSPISQSPLPLISLSIDPPSPPFAQRSEGGVEENHVQVQNVRPESQLSDEGTVIRKEEGEKERDKQSLEKEGGDSTKQTEMKEKPIPLTSVISNESVDSSVSSKQFDWRSVLAAPEFVPRGKKEKKEESEGAMHDDKGEKEMEKKEIRRWTRMDAVDQEEDEGQSMESEYHNWLTRLDVNGRGSSGDSSSDSEASIVPLPSSLPESTWGRGIEMVATVSEKEKYRMGSPLNARTNVFGRVVPTFGRLQCL